MESLGEVYTWLLIGTGCAVAGLIGLGVFIGWLIWG